MNLQGISIIFVIIFLPIFLVSTFYIKNEIDTINMQTSYDAKLIDATTDALSAFEINTANENMSQMEDSLRSMIEASNSIFTTTLATNLGMSGASQNKILPYIPAIVYTLYDGYYIYSPTQSPMVLTSKTGRYVKVGDEGVEFSSTDGDYHYYPNDASKKVTYDGFSMTEAASNIGRMLYCLDANCDPNASEDAGYSIKCTVDPEKAYFTTKYMLKSFTPYTMSYVKEGDFDITINYTLDNFIKISGTKIIDGKEVYFTKSGYLIDTDSMNLDPSIFSQIDTDDKIDKVLSAGNVTIKFSNGIEISSGAPSATSKDYTTGSTVSDNMSAVKYYLKAYAFSKWVKDNFGNLNESYIKPENTELQDGFKIKQQWLSLAEGDSTKLFYSYGDNNIFFTKDASGTEKWNVNNSESNFYEHKRNVIKNSIQYNLNMAMVTYNAGQGDEYYQMPILSDPEWDKLLSNVSILSFMQGLPCGLKTYNNYAIVTSKNNEIMTNLDDIYYIPITDGSVDGVKTSSPDASGSLDTAHHIDCVDDDWIDGLKTASYFQSYSSKDAKYDKEYVSTLGNYFYDHLANNCYYCIIDNNYDNRLSYLIDYYKNNGNIDVPNGIYKDFKDSKDITEEHIKKIVTAEMIATAKIKNNTYKSIASLKNYGVYTEDRSDKLISADGMSSTNFPLTIPNGCYSIQVTLDVAINKKKYVGTITERANLVCDGYNERGERIDSYTGGIISDNSIQTFLFDVDGKSSVVLKPNKTQQYIITHYERDDEGNQIPVWDWVNIYDTIALKSVIYYYK